MEVIIRKVTSDHLSDDDFVNAEAPRNLRSPSLLNLRHVLDAERFQPRTQDLLTGWEKVLGTRLELFMHECENCVAMNKGNYGLLSK